MEFCHNKDELQYVPGGMERLTHSCMPLRFVYHDQLTEFTNDSSMIIWIMKFSL